MSPRASDTERLWNELHASLHGFVARRVRNAADADDVVQRIFLQIHRGLGTVREEPRVHAWIYQTARNVIADYYRAPAARREVAMGALVDLAESSQHAEERINGREGALGELAACLQPLMQDLSHTDAEALRMTELGGLTQPEAARRLGLSISGMKSRVQRARQRLRAALEACCRIEVDRRGAVVAYEPRWVYACQACVVRADDSTRFSHERNS